MFIKHDQTSRSTRRHEKSKPKKRSINAQSCDEDIRDRGAREDRKTRGDQAVSCSRGAEEQYRGEIECDEIQRHVQRHALECSTEVTCNDTDIREDLPVEKRGFAGYFVEDCRE